MAHADFPMKGQRTQVKQEPGNVSVPSHRFCRYCCGIVAARCSPVGSNLRLSIKVRSLTRLTSWAGRSDQSDGVGADDLSGEFPVSDTARPVLPLIGESQGRRSDPPRIGDRNPFKAGGRLFEGSEGFDPDHELPPDLCAWRVSKPGDHPYVPGMTVRSAIALAGGFTPGKPDFRRSDPPRIRIQGFGVEHSEAG